MPETLIALSLLREKGGRTFLLGDHFQLGPVVLSDLAKRIGNLQHSMLERVANERFSAASAREDKRSLDKDTLSKCEEHGLFFLTESYRSHPAIMNIYNRMFYAGQLDHRTKDDQTALSGFFKARGLPGPVALHNVKGEELRDSGSSSAYNLDEIAVVQDYIHDLLLDQVKPQDIGVITPYAKQEEALRRQLQLWGPAVAGVEVGTVERFQGQERKVIIISAVRSEKPRGDTTQRSAIGFVGEPKRLNVAVSRAVAGLIIVGNLERLARHSFKWRELVEMGQKSGTIVGDPLSWPPPKKAKVEVEAAADARPADTADVAESARHEALQKEVAELRKQVAELKKKETKPDEEPADDANAGPCC